MDDERLHHLLAGYQAGSLSEEDETALLRALEESPARRRDAAWQIVIERLLRQVPQPATDPRRVLDALPRTDGDTVARVMLRLPGRRPRTRSWGLAAACSALAAAAAVALFVGRPGRPGPETAGGTVTEPARPRVARAPAGPRPTLTLVEGEVHRAGETAEAGDAVEADGAVSTGGGAAMLALPGGARLQLGPRTRLRLEDGAAALEAGLLVVDAPAAALVLRTPEASITATGARLVVAAGEGQTRVEVQHGAAEVIARGGNRRARITSARHALVTANGLDEGPAGRRALFVGGTEDKDRRLDADDLVVRRLEKLGWAVIRKSDAEATSTDGRAAALVVISSSVAAEKVGTRFRDVDVPLVVSEPWLLDELGMTAAGRVDNQAYWRQEVTIVRPDHPLAAGLSGPVVVASAPVLVAWGRPNGVAVTVAIIEGALQRAPLFAYEKGAAMPGLVAPARRLFFFAHDGTALDLNEAGWALFDAAVRWCADAP